MFLCSFPGIIFEGRLLSGPLGGAWCLIGESKVHLEKWAKTKRTFVLPVTDKCKTGIRVKALLIHRCGPYTGTDKSFTQR